MTEEEAKQKVCPFSMAGEPKKCKGTECLAGYVVENADEPFFCCGMLPPEEVRVVNRY